MDSQQENAGTLLGEQSEEAESLSKSPLYKVQRRALVDAAAAAECARRYVANTYLDGRAPAYQQRIVESYLSGLRAEPNRYGQHYGGNFTSRLRGAYQAGKKLRDELIAGGFGVVEVTASVPAIDACKCGHSARDHAERGRRGCFFQGECKCPGLAAAPLQPVDDFGAAR